MPTAFVVKTPSRYSSIVWPKFDARIVTKAVERIHHNIFTKFPKAYNLSSEARASLTPNSCSAVMELNGNFFENREVDAVVSFVNGPCQFRDTSLRN